MSEPVKALEKADAMLIAKRIFEIKRELETHKALYSEMDELTCNLLDLVGTDTDVVVVNEAGMNFVSIVDNFATKNTVFRPTGVRRFEVSIESATERVTKELKSKKKQEK